MDNEDIDIENDSAEAMVSDPPGPSHSFDQEHLAHRNPVAVDMLPRNVDDIYSNEPILSRLEAAPIVFNSNNCVDAKKLCEDIPWCPPDNDTDLPFTVNYVLPAERVEDVGDLTIDGLAPWNSRDDGNYMKSTIKSVAVVFGSDGSVHTRNMDGRTQIPCDCILRCFYAKNPNESKLTKRAFFAITNRRDKRPRPGTFVVITYEYSSGPARLYPRVHKSARHRHAFRRTRCSMANLIKEELMVRPPKEAREAVARKVGLPMDMPVEEVIPMRAVYDIAKTVKNRARVMKQGRKPALSKAKPEVEADFLPDSEDMYIIRQDAGKVEEYGVVEQEPYYDNFGAVVDADVEVVSSDHVECHPCYSAIEVSDFKSFRLPSIFLEELSKLEQQKLIEKAQTMKVISTSRLGTNEEYNIVSDEKERKSFYVDLNVDVNVLPPYCECGYEGKRRICAHVLATLFQRIDGQYIMDLIEERILRELRVMKSTQLQRMRRALNTDVPSTSQASSSSSVGH